MKDYDEFMAEIKSVIKNEIKSFLKEEGFYRCIPGEITETNGDKCTVDTVVTSAKNILNKSGEGLEQGDSVLLMEKYGSNYSNSFILAKNGSNRNSGVLEDLIARVSTVESKIKKLKS